MASAREESRISPYRKLLIDLSMELTRRDLERLIYAVGDILPRRLTENMESGLKLFEALEQDVHISPQNLNLLQMGLIQLAERILRKEFRFSQVNQTLLRLMVILTAYVAF